MTKHQKVKICQDLYRNETENYKHEQLGKIIHLVLFVFCLCLYWFIAVFLLNTKLLLWLRLACLL